MNTRLYSLLVASKLLTNSARSILLTAFLLQAVTFLCSADNTSSATLSALDSPSQPLGQKGETKSSWNGYDQYNFMVDGRSCLIVAPKRPLQGNPWIWRTEFFGAFAQADLALLDKGLYVAYMDLQNMYGAPVGLDHMDKFYSYVTSTYHLAPKVALEGFSRGGLFAFNWAARNSSEVSCMYVDAPVCDIKSWPGGKGKGTGSPSDWELCKQAYGFTEEQALSYSKNPIDNLQPLADAHIDILSVCGGADTGVPVAENTAIVEERYTQMGGNIKVIIKPGVGHHPHSLDDPTPIVEFVLHHSR